MPPGASPKNVGEMQIVLNEVREIVAAIQQQLEKLPDRFVSRELWSSEHERLRDHISQIDHNRKNMQTQLLAKVEDLDDKIEAVDARITSAFRLALTSLIFPIAATIIAAVMLAAIIR